ITRAAILRIEASTWFRAPSAFAGFAQLGELEDAAERAQAGFAQPHRESAVELTEVADLPGPADELRGRAASFGVVCLECFRNIRLGPESTDQRQYIRMRGRRRAGALGNVHCRVPVGAAVDHLHISDPLGPAPGLAAGV